MISQSIGIEMPPDFPTAAHNTVNIKLGPYQQRNPRLWTEYAGGWNAVAIRFKTAVVYDDLFTTSIRQHQAAPVPDERQVQEEALFTFFVTGYAVIESFAYALFALAAMLRPTDFPMVTKANFRSITPTLTEEKFRTHFAGIPIQTRFSTLVAAAEYKKWGRIRNVLAHRAAPPRQHAVGGGTEGTAWQIVGGLVLDDRTTRDKREWLARILTDCVLDTETFADSNFR